MKYYWKDLLGPDLSWSGLAINISEAGTPHFFLQSGENGRIKVINSGKTLFWATIADNYYGVWMIKSFLENSIEESPIPPIKSNIIEELKNKKNDDYFKAWSRYFIEQISESRSSFLFNGLWFINGLNISEGNNWNFKSNDISGKIDCVYACNVKNSIDRPKLDWIDWWDYGAQVIGLKNRPDENEGRVKWWRKKIKEEALPPIFVLYLTCLDSYIIIDGHSRLLASILENIPPNLLVIYSANEIENPIEIKVQDKVLNSVIKENENNRKKPISVDKLNKILIEAFDDRPVIQAKMNSQVVYDFDVTWKNEVQEELIKANLTDKLEHVLCRNSP